MRPPTPTEIQAEQARRSLRVFVELAWPELEPGTSFVPGFHIDAICSHLDAISRGELRRLLINIPPRHGKSLLCSVFWFAWVWITRPETRWLYASYAQQLATRDSLKSRRLIESPWYQTRWGNHYQLTSDQNAKARFENDRTGLRIATSVGGAVTGEGGDFLIADDPHKIEEATSPAAREATIDWYATTFSTRLNDPRRGGKVIVGQRLHERDLFGHLLEEGGWEHLCLPAEYEPSHPFYWRDEPRSTPGELLWPARFGANEIAELKRSLGSHAAAGQLQQRPAPAGGGIFKTSWWGWYDPAQPPTVDTIAQSWDLSFSDKLGADYVVGQAWGASGANLYLLDQTRERLSFTDTLTAIGTMTERLRERFPSHRAPAILIEQAANGAAVIDYLRDKIPSVIAVPPQGNKLSRAQAISPRVEAGNIWLPGAANADQTSYDRTLTPDWVQAFVHEAESFPAGAYDDQVDALTQAVIYLSRPGFRFRFLR